MPGATASVVRNLGITLYNLIPASHTEHDCRMIIERLPVTRRWVYSHEIWLRKAYLIGSKFKKNYTVLK